MLQNKHLHLIGTVLGEALTCMLLALGLIILLTLILNGFSLMATAEFIENFTRRMTEATGPRAAQFERVIVLSVLFLTGLNGAVRALDRRTLEKKEAQS